MLLAVLLAVHIHVDTVVVKNPPGFWRPTDTLIVVSDLPSPPRHPSSVVLSGEFTVFNEYLKAASGSFWSDKFRLELPSSHEALMKIQLPGQPVLAVPTKRDTMTRPWGPGPGVAWVARMYDHDVMKLWGYDTGSGSYVGKLEMHTTTPSGKDTVYNGYWRTTAVQPLLHKRHKKPIAPQIKFKPPPGGD